MATWGTASWSSAVNGRVAVVLAVAVRGLPAAREGVGSGESATWVGVSAGAVAAVAVGVWVGLGVRVGVADGRGVLVLVGEGVAWTWAERAGVAVDLGMAAAREPQPAINRAMARKSTGTSIRRRPQSRPSDWMDLPEYPCAMAAMVSWGTGLSNFNVQFSMARSGCPPLLRAPSTIYCSLVAWVDMADCLNYTGWTIQCTSMAVYRPLGDAVDCHAFCIAHRLRDELLARPPGLAGIW
ncbi:hypothetical protein RY27_28315 [Litorilinea aerophila]|nr:hypothetical protein RY27_28315 [Litorilinea aerophila]